MLELKNAFVSAIDGDIEIISNISLKLESKKIYVVTGPNGGGKTSLAKAIMGIYPVSSGAIYLDDEDITKKTVTERAKKGIGYAFQAPPRFKGLSVRDLLSIASWGQEWSIIAAQDKDTNEKEKKLFSLLTDVGLCAQDYIDRELNASFSGGELKRVEIAGILAKNLKVALFDEPEAGIDLWSFQKLTEAFKKLNEITSTTIVIISHQERILRLADEVILLCGGKVTDITSPDKILGDIDYFSEPGCFCPNCYARR
ncbi:MAG: ATP-binding cassette domain-containing protein [Oscillospiraceae bacterium]|nr:ATP-binding cassette domain-containing protein [Oscillospiraceae bacterium]